MRTLSIFLLFLSLSTLISCGSNQQTTTVNPHKDTHQQVHEDFKNEEIQKNINEKYINEISGTYLGMLPCADCEIIIYRLQLNNDKTYQSKITYQGKSDKPILVKGTYTINNRLLIQLDEQAGSMNLFQKESKGLLLLDKNGNKITGDLADNYSLLPITKEVSNNKNVRLQKIIQKKYQEGIDFYAFGNEPFWSLDMDFEKGFHFKNLEGLDFNAPSVEPVKAMDANVSRYRSITESGEIIIQLNQTGCTDNMSGEKFDYSVSIDIKTSNEEDYKKYKGCGNYVPDYKLNDIWAIIEVDGIKIDPSNFNKNAPRIEINLIDKNILGTDGCNTFRGSINVEKNIIYFGNLASTMMACTDNTEISTKIGKILSNNKLSYDYKNNLIFYDNGKKVMELKHID
ncbi:MAG: copper resistance protein NlpE N-terminal domain-containing protein [Bacteroidota bacterium]